MVTANTQTAMRYALEECLSLRDSLSVVLCPVTRIHHQNSLESILRIPKEAFQNPQTFYCKTKDITKELSRFRTEYPSVYRRGYSSSQAYPEESLGRPVNSHSHPFRGNQHVHWQLQRSDSPDRAEPYSAPSNPAAQQSENFQRFYRAVVSPTHVRVTAGGRIVPNTRVPAQLVPGWSAENYPFSPHNQNDQAETNQPATWNHGDTNLANIATSAYLPAVASVIAVQPICNAAVPDCAATSPVMASQGQQLSPEREGPVPAAEQTSRVEPDSIKISHPSQFDQTKPFMYNGHLVYPAPPGFQPPANARPLPMPMLGAPTFLPQGMMGGLPLHGASFFPGNPLAMMAAGQPQPAMLPNGSLGVPHGFQGMAVHPHIFAPFAPLHPHTVPLSEHTKQLLQGYRMQVEQLNAGTTRLDQEQLMYTRNSLSSQIMMLETMLNEQLKNERTFAEGYAQEMAKPEKSYVTDSSASANVIHPRPESTRHSRLSATSAMAPPFKPRSQSKAVPITRPVTPATPFEPEIMEIPQSAMDEIESRFLSKVEWSETRKSDASHKKPVRVNLPKAHTVHSMQSRTANDNVDVDYADILKRSNTYHARSESIKSPSARPSALPQAVPYLVGAFPQGAQTSGDATASLTYPRPLNEDEIRARHLYWGKAPRSAFKGLPKFDGKDFYPASPTKVPTRSSAQTPVLSRDKTATPDFTNLFLESCNSPLSFSIAAAHGESFQPTSTFDQSAANHLLSPQNLAYGAMQPPHWLPPSHISGLVPQGQNTFGHVQLFSDQPITALNPDTTAHTDGPELETATDCEEQLDDNDARSLDSWGLPRRGPKWLAAAGKDASPDGSSSGAQSNASTVEIHLTSQKPSHQLPKLSSASTFAERVAAVSNTEQQTKFLQNILRNTAKAAPALSGTVSVTTVEGFLPQYRGTAVASLTPTMGNSPSDSTALKEVDNDATVHASSKNLIENRPLDHNHAFRPTPPEAMGAEDYMRYVAAKDDDDKKNIENAWIGKMPATGPVMGSEW